MSSPMSLPPQLKTIVSLYIMQVCLVEWSYCVYRKTDSTCGPNTSHLVSCAVIVTVVVVSTGKQIPYVEHTLHMIMSSLV